jgi:predicted phosphodiesterase
MIFIGDIHGRYNTLLKKFQTSEIKNEIFIQVGDLGVGFYTIESEFDNLNSINSWLKENNNFLYAIRGNHDNPDYFVNSPFEFSHIKFLKDFEIIQIENQNVFFVGGAISIDRLLRKEGVDYWKDEELPLIIPDIKQIFDGTSIDIVCTHNCPSFVWPIDISPIVKEFAKNDNTLLSDLMKERKRLDLLYQKVQNFNGYAPKHWVYGHMHKTIHTDYNGTKFQCCGINDFYEIKTKHQF